VASCEKVGGLEVPEVAEDIFKMGGSRVTEVREEV
jgi:hypothetical protein